MHMAINQNILSWQQWNEERLAPAGAEIVTQRSEEVRHQGSGLTSVGGIRLAELGTHPPFLHAQLDPERQEDENESE